MKTLLVALSLACLLFTGCENLGAITYSRDVGGGKAYVSIDGNGYSAGYRGTFSSKRIPGSGKQVLPPKVVPAPVSPATAAPSAIPSWLSFLNVFSRKQ